MEDTKTIASDELLLEQLQNRDWEKFWVRLMARCFWILRNRYGVKWKNDELHQFSRAIVGEIISKVFVDKERKWYIDSYPNFEDFIVSAIDSHINNELKKKEKLVFFGEIEFVNDQAKQSNESFADDTFTDQFRKQVSDALKVAGSDDDELFIFECLADGIEKAEDIRTELGMDEATYHNAWRRLKRRRKVIQEKLAANGY